MWNKVSSNKHLQKLTKQQAYRKHIISLYNMKSTINNKPPSQYNFLKYKPKAQLKKKEKDDEIQKTNNILVQKMLHNGPSIKTKDTYFKDSLNSKIVKDKKRQIDIENERLVKKIKSVNSQYSKQKFQKDTQNYDRLKSSMAFSRMHETYDLLGDNAQNQHRKNRPMSNRPRTAKV